jgi:hypothetical protein
VVLEDGSGNLIGNSYVQGTGLGPQVSFMPGSWSLLTSSVSNASDVAVDGSGNLFVADSGDNTVKEILAEGGYTTVKTLGSFNMPFRVALDGSGNLFVYDFTYAHEIVAAGGYTTVRQLYNAVSWVGGCVAVDGAGDLFVGADGTSRPLNEIRAVNGTIPSSPQVIYLPGWPNTPTVAWDLPAAIAVDEAEDLFYVDGPHGNIKEVPAANGYLNVNTLASGLYGLNSIAVDTNGNVFFSVDSSGAIMEIMAADGYASIVTVANSPLPVTGLTLDGEGNLLVANGTHGISKLDFADPQSLIFPTRTLPGLTDTTDGPQTVVVSNIGTAPLIFATPSTGANPSYPASFPENAGDARLCDTGAPLAASASCDVSMNFAPTGLGANTGSVVLTDNALNEANATQSIALSGTGATIKVFWTSPTAITYGTPLSTAQLDASDVVAGTFVYAPALGAVLPAGAHTLTVTFTPTDTADYAVQTVSVQLTVNKATPAITWGALAPITYGTPLSATQLDASTPIAGKFAYSQAAGTVLPAGSQTLSVTFTPTDQVDYVAVTANAPITVSPAVLTVTANNLSSPYGATLPALTSSVNGFVNGDGQSVLSGAAALTTTATLSSAPGVYPINAAQGTLSASNYTFNMVNGTLTITQASQTIAFPVVAAQIAGTNVDLAALASSSSGMAVSFASLTPAVCQVVETWATLSAAGSCTIQASQTGNVDYLAAAPVSQTFTVGPKTESARQGITFTPIETQMAATTVNLFATASSGLPVTFVSVSPSVCTVSGATATLIAYGTCYIQAWQGGNSQYFAAPVVTQEFGVAHAHQTVDFPAIGTWFAGMTVNLVATASSGLPVTFTATTPAVCTVSGSTATLIEYGFCRVVATQVGNGEYLEAVASQEFGVAHAH